MYFNDGSLLVPAEPQWTRYDGVKMAPLIVPDGAGPWAIRYIWCKHTENNKDFVANYFAAKSDQEKGKAGLNLRKRTAYMQEHWDPHNELINTSRDNGNMIWRVKVHNPIADSIDYVECWRSPEVLSQVFSDLMPGTELKIKDNVVRTATNQQTLRNNLYKEGFEIRRWVDPVTNWPTINPGLAMYFYWNFVQKHWLKANCRVNTMWRVHLNPWRGLYTELYPIDDMLGKLKENTSYL